MAVSFTLVPLCLIVVLENFTTLHSPRSFWLLGRQESAQQQQQQPPIWQHAVIHIVNTRFMQHQPDLVHLARARLELFKTFCLPSMLGQSLLKVAPLPNEDTPPFLWIIKIDPLLDASIREELVTLVRPHPFIILVGSNTNYGVGIRVGGWRGGEAAMDVFASDIYSGSEDLFRRAYDFRERRAILETRLDADDGLHVDYLEAVQKEAVSKLTWEFYRRRGRHPKRANKWLYWCPQVQVEWHSMPGNETPYGLFFGQQFERSCGTAGLTVGVSIGVNESSIPRMMHQTIFEQVCDSKQARLACSPNTSSTIFDCCVLVNSIQLSSLRSRTPTSSGMEGVDLLDKSLLKKLSYNATKLAGILQGSYNTKLSDITATNQWLQDDMIAILEDNLRGQCTRGHSCKTSAAVRIKKLIKAAAADRGT